jgi:hypothetical protein
MLCSKQGPIWPLLPAQTVDIFQTSRLNVVQNDKLKATILTPAQPVDSIIPAARLTPATDEGTGFVKVPIGGKGGGKVYCFTEILIWVL